ncbi:unnamed protein product [Brugia pahangi]|uniref:diacylglycerol kinase (ATP) n=1 Tax=Brugia pahangi TaxID=6280 RepID=A0A0N4TBN6_BRUPA|nr:unnamed protein product [Brugia pahangi]
MREGNIPRDSKCVVCRKACWSYECLAGMKCAWCSATNKQVQHHHMREGNIPRDSKCVVCRKACWSYECLAGMKCAWCSATAHAICYRQMSLECDFGALKKIMLPPNALTIPRTELPMKQLLNIQGTYLEASSPVKTHPEDSALNSPDEAKEKEDYENLRIFDGNSSLRKHEYRTATVPKTASMQQIRVS